MRQNSHCFSRVTFRCCSKKDPIQGPRGFRPDSQKWIVQGDTHADNKPREFIGKGRRVESGRAKEPRRTALHALHRLGFYGDGFGFSLSPANHSDSGSFWWHAHFSGNMDFSIRVSGSLAGPMPLPSSFWPPRLSCSFWGQHCVSFYQAPLLGDSSGKRLSMRLARVGGFGQQFPNTGNHGVFHSERSSSFKSRRAYDFMVRAKRWLV